ncbi:MAG: hypothetical protein ACKOBM_15835 [Gammaproteobacteria bacterium]
MIIELVGPPGSGKTLAAGRVIELLRARGLDVVGYDELEDHRDRQGDRRLNRLGLAACWRSLAPLRSAWPHVVRQVLALIWLHRAFGRKRLRKARRPLTHWAMARELAAAFPGRVIVLDDGFVQKLWSLLIGPTSLRGAPTLRALLAAYYADTGVRCVRLELPDALAESRAFDRQTRGRFHHDSGQRIRAQSGRWIPLHRDLVRLLPTATVLGSVAASAAPEVVALEVVRRLEAAIA